MSHDNNKTTTRLGGQALYMLLGNIFTLVVGFPLQVFVTRTLGAENIGIFSLFDGAASLAGNFLSFGLAPALVKFIPHCLAQRDYPGVRLLVKSGALILLVGGALAVAAVWVLALSQTGIPLIASRPVVASLMVIMVPLGLLIYFLQQALRGFLEVRYMMMGTSFLQLGVKALMAVILLKLGLGLAGYVTAVIVSTVVGCLWMAVGLWQKLRSMPGATEKAPVRYKKEWRDYSLVMYSDSLLGVGASYLDRFLLGWLSGAASVGVLMQVKQLYVLPGIFFQMFMTVASPMFSSAHARDDGKERQHIYHLIIDWVTRLSTPLCIFMLIFAEQVLALFGSDFAVKGSLSLRILVAAQLFNLVMGPVGIMLAMSGQEKFLLKLALLEQVVAVAGLCLLVPHYGINGAASVIAFGVVEQNVVGYVVARRKLGLRWFDRRYLLWLLPVLFSVVTAGIVKWYFASDFGAITLVLLLASLYLVFFAISLLQGLHEDDKNFLLHVSKRLFNDKE